MNADRPLDGITSIKVKLAVLVGTSVLGALLVAALGDVAGIAGWVSAPVTLAVALGLTWWLARGMTSPLREMTDAARRMAAGDYAQRVTATSSDEVGELARAFNAMAGDLAGADLERRRLVATVSHELRTPLTAQRALLENLVDGVMRPDDAALAGALAQAERPDQDLGAFDRVGGVGRFGGGADADTRELQPELEALFRELARGVAGDEHFRRVHHGERSPAFILPHLDGAARD